MDAYRLLVNLPDTVIFLSPDLKVIDATDEYLRVTMRTREELVGKEFLTLFPDNPTEQESKNMALLKNSLERAIQTKQQDFLPTLRYDIPRPQAQGGGFDERHWEAVHQPVLDENGEVSYVIQKTSDVTVREQARKAAALEESKFKFILNALPQLIYTTAPLGDTTFFNDRWFDYTGTSRTNITEQDWQEIIHPVDLEKIREQRRNALANGQEYQAEVRVKNQRGAYRWFLSRTVPMHGEDGQLILWVTSMVDIHDTRQLVRELEESNQQMVELSEQAQLGFRKAEAERKTLENLIMKAPVFFCVLKGPEHRYEMLNDKYAGLFPNKELLGYTVEEVFPELVEQGYLTVLNNVYHTGKEFVAERIVVKLDRNETGTLEEMTLTFMYQAMYDEHEQATGIMVCGYEVGAH